MIEDKNDFFYIKCFSQIILFQKGSYQIQRFIQKNQSKISLMQPQQKTQIKTVLRHLEQTSPHLYLIPYKTKLDLLYPQKCLPNPENVSQLKEMVSIDCEMLKTQKGEQLCRVVIVDQNYKEIFNQWYLPSSPVTDYLTHITGITQQVLQQNAKNTYTEQAKQQILALIKDKIVVGHDLANDLKVLHIQHHAFIDTIHICPHHFGLPHKNKLKGLAMDLLCKPIQWGNHDPVQDAVTTLQIVKQHLLQGKGIVAQVQFNAKRPQDYKSIWQIIEDAQLDRNKIAGLFLRGSRALDLQMDEHQYKSDWDYFCVYDTWAKIDGRLIKFPQIDITIYDLTTFNNYTHQQNDIPLLQLFSLPQQHQIINKLQYPVIHIQKIRQSLGFHLMKSKMKIKRFRGDQSKNWKILKAVHMKIRFMDYFLQIYDHGKILDVKRVNYIWDQFKQHYKTSKSFQHSYKKCQTVASQFMQKVRIKYKSLRKVHGVMGIQANNKPNEKLLRAQHKNIVKMKPSQMHKLHSSQQVFKPNPVHSNLHIVKQLIQNGFDNLDKLKIIMKRANLYQNLIEFKYMQSASFKNPICHQARGIILDEDRNFEVVALPYYKFFDYNDTKYSQLKDFDFTDYKIYQKFDGSIAFIYYYAGQWHVASSTVPDASSNYCFARKQTTTEFRKQFWRIFNEKKYELPQGKDKNKTFVFQLMSKNHIIVTNRTQDFLVLHGVRDRNTLQQEDHLIYKEKYNWQVAEPIKLQLQDPLNPMEEIVQITQKLDPLKQEGFILCDKKYTRMKVKSSNYLRINWLGELNITKHKDPSKYILINIVLAGQAETFAQYCPQWRPTITQFCTKIEKFNNVVFQQFEQIKHLDKKQFVVEVKKKNHQIQPFFFVLKQNQQFYKGRLQTTLLPKKFYQFIVNLNFDHL